MENDRLLFRLAAAEDAERILEIIRQAQAQMRARGSDQWQHGYPASPDIARDIARANGYVLCEPAKGRVIAYGAVIFSGEPAYDSINGKWLYTGPYVVVHRLAVAAETKGQGVGTEFMRRTEALARSQHVPSFRVDTNFDNAYMLRMLSSLGFVLCGEIDYEGDKRLAFEKPLE